MAIYHVSLGFARGTDPELDAFTENVIASMTGNASYTTPVPTLASVTTASTTFKNALSAAASGGHTLTAIKDAARAALLVLMRQLALYVQGIANNNNAVLLSSGFHSTTTVHTQTPLIKPFIVNIQNEVSTQVVLRVTPIHDAVSYEIRYSSVPGTWVSAPISTQAKRVVVEGLTPGTIYTFQVRAVGGSTGFSDWSDPVSHMAM